MKSNIEKIKNYGLDLDYIGDISPFELIGTLILRDDIAKADLTFREKALLKSYDKKLLENAENFYNELKKVYDFQNRKPLDYWWSNIDLVVNGEIIVDIDNNKVWHTEKS